MSLRDQIKVLVVDDMSTSRGLITQALDAIGIRQIDTATNGRDALESIRKRSPHLVISDMNMPEINGLQLLHAIRTDPRTTNTGFLLITSKVDKSIIETGKKLRMNNFLPKPFQPGDLTKAIEAIFGRL
ncbi:response regulator [Maritimibacter sp. DP1N21-5]|uniref:response regulator n=1 Tax=Maritimibacter sp. DP1N21-5 TaxID=2836867 RepID=UPI001C48E425|nr:response regulator [Maritimibacter sp. DP1N21-5]MBV7409868.1 response regulator [Maritimibacter sp. DP1N21-5]